MAGVADQRKKALAKRKAAKAHAKTSTGKMARDLKTVKESSRRRKGESVREFRASKAAMKKSIRQKQAKKANYQHEG